MIKLRKRWSIESRQTRGPVTAVHSVDGKLLAALGSSPCSVRLFRYDVRTNSLMAMSFYDTPFAVVSLDVVKNYILMGDIYRSVQLVHWRVQKRDFKLLAKHTKEPVKVLDSKVVLYNKNTPGIVIADGSGNLRILNYNPAFDQLQHVADIRISAKCFQLENAIHRLHHITFATQHGNIGILLPLTEQSFRKLNALQAAISTLHPHNAGLNPRSLRVVKNSQQQTIRQIADGTLLLLFHTLPTQTQKQIASFIGTTPHSLINELKQILDYAYQQS